MLGYVFNFFKAIAFEVFKYLKTEVKIANSYTTSQIQ